MALLKPPFLRAHPIQSGMIWAAGFVLVLLASIWATGIIPIQPAIVVLLVLCSAMGGLSWGYAMKAYHDRGARL